jgi:hypothetical protein
MRCCFSRVCQSNGPEEAVDEAQIMNNNREVRVVPTNKDCPDVYNVAIAVIIIHIFGSLLIRRTNISWMLLVLTQYATASAPAKRTYLNLLFI